MSDNENNEYYNDSLNYYQRNIDRLRKYNRDYYHYRQQTNPIYKKNSQPYVSGRKIMCIKCGAIIREKYMKTHVKSKSCKYPHTVPLKKRNLINLKEQIDSDDDEYFKL